MQALQEAQEAQEVRVAREAEEADSSEDEKEDEKQPLEEELEMAQRHEHEDQHPLEDDFTQETFDQEQKDATIEAVLQEFEQKHPANESTETKDHGVDSKSTEPLSQLRRRRPPQASTTQSSSAGATTTSNVNSAAEAPGLLKNVLFHTEKFIVGFFASLVPSWRPTN